MRGVELAGDDVIGEPYAYRDMHKAKQNEDETGILFQRLLISEHQERIPDQGEPRQQNRVEPEPFAGDLHVRPMVLQVHLFGEANSHA